MPQIKKKLYKDIGLQREVEDALPYAVVGDAWEGSFTTEDLYDDLYYTASNYVVPTGHQLKILFLRIWTSAPAGVRYAIVQENPSTALSAADVAAGKTEAFPVVGSVPPGAGVTDTPTFRDFPMMEAAGAEILHGSLVDPIHVLEGSIDFNLLALWPGAHAQLPHTASRYGLAWWGVIKIPEPTR